MPLLKGQPLRRQIVTAACILLLPLAGAIGWAAMRTLAERRSATEEQAGSLAVTMSAYLDQYLTGLDALAHALITQRPVMDLDTAESNRLFSEVMTRQPMLLNVLLTDTHGKPLASGTPPPAQPPRTNDRPWVGDVLAANGPIVSGLVTGNVSGKPTVVLAYPVRDGSGAIVGVLGLGVNLIKLQGVFASIPLPAESVVMIRDRSNRIVAQSLAPERYVGTRIDDAKWDAQAIRTGVDGVQRLYADAPIMRAPWRLSVGIPRSFVLSRIAPLWRRNFLIVLTVFFATMLLALWFVRIVSGHVNHLREAAQRIAEGDLSTPAVRPVPTLELAELQNAFVAMAGNLRRAHEALDRRVLQERAMNETLQSLQRQLLRQERLAAVGLLASGVAHELNNPLQAIVSAAELIDRQAKPSADSREALLVLKMQSTRAREIIRSLARFASAPVGNITAIRLGDVAASVVGLRAASLQAAGVTVDVNDASSLDVQANFADLEEATMNLVINAEQALQAAGLKPGVAHIELAVADAVDCVRLEVRDNGPGVSIEDEQKLFQPFFTTRPVGQGSGLGLSATYGIVQSYGGTIGYTRNASGGSTFYFELPSADASARELATGTTEPPTDTTPRPHGRRQDAA